MPDSGSSTRSHRLGRGLALGAVVLVVVWVAFFDSHSIQKRLRFRQQHARLTAENDSLRRQIEALQEKLQSPPADSTIERIAREEYGMRRPGETVYRVEQ
ncbi:MAG: septation ring formation regulator EzrA [Bacteroidetes bacterium QS_8_68_28]|jgi:cell division protein FtsB|nr:MAG: septation ring formation regulator EzrA [Bacteroidetes bacterium QS_8_68_28]